MKQENNAKKAFSELASMVGLGASKKAEEPTAAPAGFTPTAADFF